MNQQHKIGLFTGSFDVFTNGHKDIVRRALGIFDRLIIGIGVNPNKTYLFPLKTRVDTIRILMQCYEVTEHPMYSRVEVVEFNGLAADFAYETGVTHIVKGIRDPNDFNYEQLLHEITISQHAGLETISLYSSSGTRHISSSAVKELCRYQGLIHEYVHIHVKEQLEWALNKQFIVGVVGEIAVGKSHVSDKIVAHVNSRKIHSGRIDAHNIDMDKLVHDIYVRTEPVYVEVRKQIIREFNLPDIDIIDRKALGDIVFNSSSALSNLNSILRTPIITRLRQVIRGKTGLILLNGSLLAESNMLSLCNNNVIVVTRPRFDQMKALSDRGLSEEQAMRRINSQFSATEKIRLIDDKIHDDASGRRMQYVNTSDSSVEHLTDSLMLMINQRSLSVSKP